MARTPGRPPPALLPRTHSPSLRFRGLASLRTRRRRASEKERGALPQSLTEVVEMAARAAGSGSDVTEGGRASPAKEPVGGGGVECLGPGLGASFCCLFVCFLTIILHYRQKQVTPLKKNTPKQRVSMVTLLHCRLMSQHILVFKIIFLTHHRRGKGMGIMIRNPKCFPPYSDIRVKLSERLWNSPEMESVE